MGIPPQNMSQTLNFLLSPNYQWLLGLTNGNALPSVLPSAYLSMLPSVLPSLLPSMLLSTLPCFPLHASLHDLLCALLCTTLFTPLFTHPGSSLRYPTLSWWINGPHHIQSDYFPTTS